jgi:hypothetical protein
MKHPKNANRVTLDDVIDQQVVGTHDQLAGVLDPPTLHDTGLVEGGRR